MFVVVDDADNDDAVDGCSNDMFSQLAIQLPMNKCIYSGCNNGFLDAAATLDDDDDDDADAVVVFVTT